MGIYDAYETDSTSESEGVWTPFPAAGPSVKVKLARAGGSNRRWAAEREKVLRPIRKSFKGADLPEGVLMDALVVPFCKILLLDWEGVTDREGVPLECNQGNKLKICADLPDFYEEMLGESGSMDKFKVIEDEEDAGKSQSGSSGTNNTPTPTK